MARKNLNLQNVSYNHSPVYKRTITICSESIRVAFPKTSISTTCNISKEDATNRSITEIITRDMQMITRRMTMMMIRDKGIAFLITRRWSRRRQWNTWCNIGWCWHCDYEVVNATLAHRQPRSKLNLKNNFITNITIVQDIRYNGFCHLSFYFHWKVFPD